ncbi:MAG TPA: endopeptidase, partial [Vicinamibacteria bacterium]|nr:endopeptidase [Vicinamibacteria bacterium]
MTHSPSRSLSRAFVLVLLASVAATTALAAVAPREQPGFLDRKEFFRPELSLTSSNVALEQVEASLPNRAAWQRFRSAAASLAAPGHGFTAYIDPRSGAASNLAGAFPLIPGSGVGNAVSLESLGQRLGRAVTVVDAAAVADAVAAFVRDHQATLGVDAGQLGAARASRVSDILWHVSIPQAYQGLPVRYGRVAATIVQGNLVTIGA